MWTREDGCGSGFGPRAGGARRGAGGHGHALGRGHLPRAHRAAAGRLAARAAGRPHGARHAGARRRRGPDRQPRPGAAGLRAQFRRAGAAARQRPRPGGRDPVGPGAVVPQRGALQARPARARGARRRPHHLRRPHRLGGPPAGDRRAVRSQRHRRRHLARDPYRRRARGGECRQHAADRCRPARRRPRRLQQLLRPGRDLGQRHPLQRRRGDAHGLPLGRGQCAGDGILRRARGGARLAADRRGPGAARRRRERSAAHGATTRQARARPQRSPSFMDTPSSSVACST